VLTIALLMALASTIVISLGLYLTRKSIASRNASPTKLEAGRESMLQVDKQPLLESGKHGRHHKKEKKRKAAAAGGDANDEDQTDSDDPESGTYLRR